MFVLGFVNGFEVRVCPKYAWRRTMTALQLNTRDVPTEDVPTEGVSFSTVDYLVFCWHNSYYKLLKDNREIR